MLRRRPTKAGLKYRAERKTYQGADATAEHAQNFVKQVRIGTKGAVDEMVGHTATAACHLGTIAAKSGQNPALERGEGRFRERRGSLPAADARTAEAVRPDPDLTRNFSATTPV